MQRVAWITHPVCAQHESGPWHPERAERIAAITDALDAAGIAERLLSFDAPRATRSQLQRVHTLEYVASMLDAPPLTDLVLVEGDTVIGPHSVQAALRAAGAVIQAVDLVLGGTCEAAFCNVRPPGHHAERGRAMGFCLFGNVAVGAAHALAQHGLERIAVVDFDVHHGNGTEDLLRDEPRALLCSSFQHPFYPYTGADTVSDHILNVPLAAGTGSAAYREAVAAAWFERVADFGPELVFFSAGFDAHREDPLADLQLEDDDYAWITREILRVTRSSARGRAVSALEGGYALGALGRSALAHLRALLGD